MAAVGNIGGNSAEARTVRGVLDRNSRDYFDQRLGELNTERKSFVSHWQELSKFVLPRRGRFFVEDRNKGDKRYNNIINSTATMAHKRARAGMFAGTHSPARPWFKLETPDRDLMEFQPVRIWLAQVENIIRRVYEESNFYRQSPILIGEVLQFGTGAMYHMDDFENVAHFHNATCGQYYVDQNSKHQIDTIVREFQWTTRQVVETFGYDNCSTTVRQNWDAGNYSTWVDVVHFVEPNPDYEPDSPVSRKQRFRSVYYEKAREEKNKFLRIRGFRRFPAYVPRWETTAEDIYGTDCPAMTALGDIKQLQVQEKRKGQGIDKMVNPPLTGPAELRKANVNSLPGGLTVYGGDDTRQKLRSIYDVRLPIQELRGDIEEVKRQINEAFYIDLFLAISNMEGVQPRNELDLIQRNEERLLMLGPTLQQLQGDFLGQSVEAVFEQLVAAKALPNPPQQLGGTNLRVRFVSTLAMAQRAVATQNIERLFEFAGRIGEAWPQALDKLDPDQAIDEYADAIGAPPRIVRPDDEVAQRREEEAQRRQAEDMLAMAQSGAQTAKTAVEAEAIANGG